MWRERKSYVDTLNDRRPLDLNSLSTLPEFLIDQNRCLPFLSLTVFKKI